MPTAEKNPVRAHLDALRTKGRKALCQFLIAGDPTPETAADLAQISVAAGVDVVELCMPFARSITDGPVVQAGYARALAAGMTLERALAAMAQLATRLPVVFLADYRATVAPLGLADCLARAAGHGAGAVLLHGLPPLMRPALIEAAAREGLGVVGSAYPRSAPETLAGQMADSSAFLYLVSSYGRSGGQIDTAHLSEQVARARALGDAPLAVGFGIRTADDHRAVFRAGADMSITGSAFTGLIAQTLTDPAALRAGWHDALTALARARDDAASAPTRSSEHA